MAVPADRVEEPVREFAAFTADLYRLADWLVECRVDTVVMESTGVYWIPLFGVLEERGFQVMLVDPRRIKNVPGRKTDVLDCQWLQQLHTYGLLSGAFRPEGEIRRLRSYLRQRAMLVEYASQHIQHMQKALTQMNVKLHHVISDITGKTGMEIIKAIVGGQRDPVKLAQLRDPRIKADGATIAKSLRGHWREEHIFELTQALELYRAYQGKIAECYREIEAHLERFEDRSTGEPPAAKSGRRRIKGNAPRFDVWTHLYRMTGVDLTRIDGVDAYTALKVISEIGTDMTKWPSAKHFASWLGLSPNNRITGGRVISSKAKPSANRAAAALRLAANALHRSDSALGAFLRQKKAQLGAPKAITATAHKLARLIYSMLRYGQEYVDAGAEYYERQYQQRALRSAKQRAAQLGYQLVPMSDAPDYAHLRTTWRANRRVTTWVSGRGLADRRIKVDGERCVAGSGPSRPGPGQQLPAHPVQLADMAPPETAQESAQGGRRLDSAAQVVRAVPPVRNTSASSIQSPPAMAEATRVISLSPVLARPARRPGQGENQRVSRRPRCRARVAGRISPALATRR